MPERETSISDISIKPDLCLGEDKCPIIRFLIKEAPKILLDPDLSRATDGVVRSGLTVDHSDIGKLSDPIHGQKSRIDMLSASCRRLNWFCGAIDFSFTEWFPETAGV